LRTILLRIFGEDLFTIGSVERLNSPSTALDTRAVLLSSLSGNDSVPTLAMQVAVSQNDKHLLAFGCQPYAGGSTDFDPLLIRWASQDEPEYWNPTGTTPGGAASSAGFLRVSRGSEIVAALATRQETSSMDRYDAIFSSIHRHDGCVCVATTR
jgi:hypothetical protein